MATSKKPNLTYGRESIAQDCMRVLRPFSRNRTRATVAKVFGQCKSGDTNKTKTHFAFAYALTKRRVGTSIGWQSFPRCIKSIISKAVTWSPVVEADENYTGQISRLLSP